MLTLSFFLALFAFIAQGVWLTGLPILAFAPFIALAMMCSSFHKALWLSAFAGAIADVLCDTPFGLHALNYTLVCGLLFRLKNHFLYEQPFHVSFFTSVISSVSTGLQLILLFLFDRRVPFDGRWILSDLIGMPAIDALYAFVWFSAPLSLFEKLKKTWVLFWLKRKSLSRTSP